MRTVGGHMTLVSTVCWIWFGSGLAAQSPAPTPGVVLTDPTRGDLRMLLDKSGLGSSDVSIGERTYAANYTSAEHVRESTNMRIPPTVSWRTERSRALRRVSPPSASRWRRIRSASNGGG